MDESAEHRVRAIAALDRMTPDWMWRHLADQFEQLERSELDSVDICMNNAGQLYTAAPVPREAYLLQEKQRQLICPECGEVLWDGQGRPGSLAALTAFGHLETHREALLARQRELTGA